MSLYGHRSGMPQSAARLNELLDQIRSEFEAQVRINEGYEQQNMMRKSFCYAVNSTPLGGAHLRSLACPDLNTAGPRPRPLQLALAITSLVA
ncbi:hypothetical protein ONZ43_g3739 [Nemania bipapillata]|uniref:Uncharacterized protein n=1 Tax=Nemania bipapillata TaxID=110536 RepID=A0ACC2IW57_9PEZI|nr:hypothetical protein ONZ43_g3739 [Nemania bipapillata]